MKTPSRFYLVIKTSPHQQWFHPKGWTADTVEDAKKMHAKAVDLWMSVKVLDVKGGTCEEWDEPWVRS